MKILITGADGQLGKALCVQLADVHTLYQHDMDLDVTDFDTVSARIHEIMPDLVIHAAAMTDVDGCERNPDMAMSVNAAGTKNVAEACRQTGAGLAYISTDFVFDGTKTEPYNELDTPNPLSVYGRSKLAGERYVSDLVKNHYIIRTAWLFGNGNNFVRTILRLAKENESLTIVDDQVGSPTYANDLATSINGLINTGAYGVYHVTNAGCCSWFEFAESILNTAGIDGVEIIPISSAALGRPARRPANSVLDNSRLRSLELPALRDWREALDEYVAGNCDFSKDGNEIV